MSQNSDIEPRLSRRQDRLMIALYVYGESRISKIKKDFEVHPDTLRRDLEELVDHGYVEVGTENVGGAANPAHVYSLTTQGSEYAATVKVSSKDETVLNRLDELEREVAELRAENQRLRGELEQWENSVKYYLESVMQVIEAKHKVRILDWKWWR